MRKSKANITEKSRPVGQHELFLKISFWAIFFWAIFVVFKFNQKFNLSLDFINPVLNDIFLVPSLSFLQVLPWYFKSFLIWFTLSIGMLGWGSKFTSDSDFTRLEAMIFSFAFGAIFLSLLVFMLGILGFYSKPTLFAFFFIYVGLGVFFGWAKLREWLSQIKSFPIYSLLSSAPRLLLFIFCALSFLMCFVPELFYDSLVYHLGLPQMFLNEGKIVKTPNVYFSHFPMLVHMLYVIGLGLDSTNVAKLINWGLMLMGLGGVYALTCRLGSLKGGIWACLFIVSMPVLQMVNWSTPVDSALGAFTVLGALFLIISAQKKEISLKWISLGGGIFGAVFAVKYTGAATIVVFSLIFFLLLRKRSISFLLRGAVLFFIFSCIASLPYLLRNYSWTKNPVYPILSSVLKVEIPEKIKNEQEIVGRYKPKTPLAFLKFPWTQTMFELSSFNFIGPMTLSGLPLMFFLPIRRFREIRYFWLIVLGYFGFSLLFSGDIRYLLPGFFILSAGLGAGLNMEKKEKFIPVLLLKSVYFGIALYHLGWLVNISWSIYKPNKVLMGSESRQAYVSRMHNGLNLWPWNSLAPTLKNLPEPCRVYILGTEQVYGFPKRFWYSSVHDETPLVLWANQSQSPNDFFTKLQAQGFTHLLFNVPEAMRLQGYNLFHWSDLGRDNFVGFSKSHLKVIEVRPIEDFKNALVLFEIKESLPENEKINNFDQIFKNVMNL